MERSSKRLQRLTGSARSTELATSIALVMVMAMGASPASGDCQRALNELVMEIYRVFDELDAPFLLKEPEVLQAALKIRRNLSDDFGSQDRLACQIVYTDDPDVSVAGPPPRVERFLFAVHSVVGPNGANWILADESKWLLATHSLWCGVSSSPMLGIVWFSVEKRLKAITGITAILSGKETESDCHKTISFVEYLVSICHWHRYLVLPLWSMVTPPRSSGPGHCVIPNSEERGKLKFLRKKITNTPGTSMLRVVEKRSPPSSALTEWAFQTDARLEPLVKAGLGGANHSVLWQLDVPNEWLDQLTIPLAEFLAHIGGAAIQHQLTPDAECLVSEIDAMASPHALISHADSTRLRVAHELYMETPLFKAIGFKLFTRHLRGIGNEAADKASRFKNSVAEAVIEGLGMEPEWRDLPSWFPTFCEKVIARLRGMHLTPLSVSSLGSYRRKKRNNDPVEAGQTAIKFMFRVVSCPSSSGSDVSSSATTSSTRGQVAFVLAPSPNPFAPSPFPIASSRLSSRLPKEPALANFDARDACKAPAHGASAGIKRFSLLAPMPHPKRDPVSPSRRSVLRTVSCAGNTCASFSRGALFGVDSAPACSAALHPPRLVSFPDDPSTPTDALSSAPADTSGVTSEASTLEALPPLPTWALRNRFEYLLNVSAERRPPDIVPTNPGLLRRVLHDFLTATHWAANKNTLDGEKSAWSRYWEPY
jgi:hypothetical protein